MSLRLRLVLGGALAIILALGLSAMGLLALFGAHVERRAEAELSGQLDQIIAGLDLSEGQIVMATAPADTRFTPPYSGHYWQVDLPAQSLRARSLWDATLTLPNAPQIDGQVMYHRLEGPDGQQLLAAVRGVVLPTRLGNQNATAIIATDLAQIITAQRAFAADLLPYILGLALVLIAAGWAQITVGLRPLSRLRARVSGVRNDTRNRIGNDWPLEVNMLATELDELLDARAADLAQAQMRAGDLAHGLKTPLQALMGEAARLREAGEDSAAQGLEEVVLSMRRTVDRELNHTRRLAGAPAPQSNLLQTVTGIVSVLRKTPDGERIDWDIKIANDLTVSLDRNDLAEALGAVLENAARFATSAVYVTAQDGQHVQIRDDGCGIPAPQRKAMLARFTRLDEHGTGMGLAIAHEILRASGGDIILSDANPGLCVDLHFGSSTKTST